MSWNKEEKRREEKNNDVIDRYLKCVCGTAWATEKSSCMVWIEADAIQDFAFLFQFQILPLSFLKDSNTKG